MDLVLDLVIQPSGRWEWKDRADFDTAVQRGLLGRELLATFELEADRILALAATHQGPFAETWRTWRPDPDWSWPELPAEFRVGGRNWSGAGG